MTEDELRKLVQDVQRVIGEVREAVADGRLSPLEAVRIAAAVTVALRDLFELLPGLLNKAAKEAT